MAIIQALLKNKGKDRTVDNQLSIGISIIGALIAIFSFFLSCYTLFIDRGRIALMIFLGNQYDLKSNKNGPPVIFISVTNIGRRPITLKAIGGDSKWNPLKKLINIFTNKVKPRGAWLSGEKVDSIIFDNGKFRVLLEGGSVQNIWPIGDEVGKILDMFKSVRNFFIEDTSGKRHLLSRSSLKRLVHDLTELRVEK